MLIYKQDQHGNVVAVMTDNGDVTEKYTFDVFGKPNIFDKWGNSRSATAVGNRFMFQGREWIGELGIYDYRHRMYQPQLGRFLQTDPMGLQTEGEKLSAGQKALFSPGGVAPEAFSSSEMNLYRYCGDDPVDGSDPLGLKPGDPFDTRAEAAKDALLFINPTSKERNAEYGGLTYVGDDGRHYATAPRTDGAGNKVDLRKSPAEMGVPKNAKRVDGDYHTHADFSRAVADRRGLTGAPPKFVPQRAPRGEDGYKSNHFSDTDIHEAFRQFRINPEFRRYLGTPDNKVLMYEPGQGEVGVP
jgi:RHS repeat-associated protein